VEDCLFVVRMHEFIEFIGVPDFRALETWQVCDGACWFALWFLCWQNRTLSFALPNSVGSQGLSQEIHKT